jgi:putative hemolysin
MARAATSWSRPDSSISAVLDSVVLRLLLLVALVVCSGLLSGAEAAYFSLGRARLRRVAKEPGAPEPVVSRPHDLLVTLLVGITVINIGASAVATQIADELFGLRWGLPVEMIVMVLLLTTFGEVLPMTLAVKYPERFLAIVRRPVRWLEALMTPIRVILANLTTLTVRLVGRGAETQAALSEDELRTLVDVGASEGVVEREEREMIHKVFELEDTLVRSVMVPRTDMFCFDVETPVDEILPALREHLHSRVPVYDGSIDVIVGVLYTKDLLPYVKGLPSDFELRAHLHPPYFVPESKRADALLQEFQAKKLHIAIVVDEFGGTAGLVALEDLLEELVGEIADEYDEPERLIQKIDASTYRVAGKLSVEDLNAATGLTISNESYDTVGGWVLDLFGRVPRKGERTETSELAVTVEKVERTRVVEVLIALRKPVSTEAAA